MEEDEDEREEMQRGGRKKKKVCCLLHGQNLQFGSYWAFIILRGPAHTQTPILPPGAGTQRETEDTSCAYPTGAGAGGGLALLAASRAVPAISSSWHGGSQSPRYFRSLLPPSVLGFLVLTEAIPS
jgi:hypothetical protein